MNPRNFKYLLKGIKRIVRNLRFYNGDRRQMSLLTRTVIFHVFHFIRLMYPQATQRQLRMFEAEYEELMKMVHQRFTTYQIGSFYAQPT